MSETLVERLRAAELYPEYVYKLRHEAADEIERLSRLSSREAVVEPKARALAIEECAKMCDDLSAERREIGSVSIDPLSRHLSEHSADVLKVAAKAIRSLASQPPPLSPPSGMPWYDKQDARRYRWLRDGNAQPKDAYAWFVENRETAANAPDNIDAAIDAAIAASPPTPETRT